MNINALLSVKPREFLIESIKEIKKAKDLLNKIRKDIGIKNKGIKETKINRKDVLSIQLDSLNNTKPYIDAVRIHVDDILEEVYLVSLNPTLDDQFGKGSTKKVLKYFPKAKLSKRAMSLGEFDRYDVA